MEALGLDSSYWRDVHDPSALHGTTVPINEELRLRLSDQDLHLIEFPNGPPTTSGGFCELYIAIYKPQNIKLAMKRLRFDFPTEDMSRRFLREAEIWATFQHPNILPFFGTMTINYRLYLVSPWMALGDLLEFVQARAKYGQRGNGQFDESVPQVYSRFDEVTVVREMAAGLAYLHSHGAIHGDMKAKNVLLNGAGCAQICDFGLTKTLEHAVTSEAVKGGGSLRWQSPELLSGMPKSPKSDVYALGMTIAEVLTCNYPFPHLKDNTAVLFALVINQERPAFDPLSQLGVDFEPLWWLAAECWQTGAEDRPTMDEVLQQLGSMGPLPKALTTDHPDPQVGATPTETIKPKIIKIITSRDDYSKRLRAPTQILLTVTPVDQSKLHVSQTPIAWKVLNIFFPGVELEFTVTWQPGIGLCTVTVDEARVVSTVEATHVPARSWTQLESSRGRYQWMSPKAIENSPVEVIVARNATSAPQPFALCSATCSTADRNWKFEPFVLLGSFGKGDNVMVGPPVMLQAYAVSGYKENQLLSSDDKDKFILTSWEGGPEPIDLREIEDDPIFMLYSDYAGRVALRHLVRPVDLLI